MSLFKPAWQSENKEKALKAVEKVKKQTKLVEIAKNSKLKEVRILACEKLTGQPELAEVAKYGSSFDVGLAAVEKLTGQIELIDVAQNTSQIMGDKIRVKAVKKINDQRILTDIAMNHEESSVRIAAAENLINCEFIQEVYAGIAKFKSLSECERRIVFSKITDQNLLFDIARTTNIAIREYALLSMTDKTLKQEVYAFLAKQCPIEKSKYNNGEDYEGSTALIYLTDKSLIADVAENACDESIRIKALIKLVDFIDNQNELADFALNNESKEVCIAATRKITNQKILADIAKSTGTKYLVTKSNPEWHNDAQGVECARTITTVIEDLRIAAVKKINDKDLLSDVMKNAKDENIRQTAKKRNENLFKQEFFKA